MSIVEMHRVQGAELAPDGIPLHYGDQAAEYRAALERAVLMDRSHEGRLVLHGRDRIDLIQRISTNDLLGMAPNEGRPTIFTNPNGRILDRVMVYHRGETLLLVTEPGRGPALQAYLQRNIFYNDAVRLENLSPATNLFVLHGPQAGAVMSVLSPDTARVRGLDGIEMTLVGAPVFAFRRKPFSSDFWTVIAPSEAAESVWNAVRAAGQDAQLALAGSLTYHVLRIRAGRPGAGHELTPDYIPLEAGLWDEVSFRKGCYTGQEIIARMESRGQLAKTLVMLRLEQPAEAPARLLSGDGKPVGDLTSSVTTPNGEHLGMGFVRMALAAPGQSLLISGSGVQAAITTLAGAQPPAANP